MKKHSVFGSIYKYSWPYILRDFIKETSCFLCSIPTFNYWWNDPRNIDEKIEIILAAEDFLKNENLESVYQVSEDKLFSAAKGSYALDNTEMRQVRINFLNYIIENYV